MLKNKKMKKQKTKKYVAPHEFNFIKKFIRFNYWVGHDVRQVKGEPVFSEFGVSLYAGMQGDGKTVSMVEKLEEIRHKFPKVMICTNFGYQYEDEALTDWMQILELRNPDGIVFAIDEIQNEFNVYETRSFNENILRVVTQQRKQGIKIFATSQTFNRVAKPLREQTFEVIDCKTMLGRWTFQKCFDAVEYEHVISDPDKKQKLSRKWRKNFVQTDYIRGLYDSYKVIDTMVKLEKEERKKEKVLAMR